MTTNVDEAKAGILIPMQNYKGYALALGLELLTGVLSGGPILSDVKHKDRNSRHKEKISHFILAIKNSNHKSITNFISIIEKTKKNKNKKNSWPGMKKYKNFITSNKNNKIELNELDYKNLDRI